MNRACSLKRGALIASLMMLVFPSMARADVALPTIALVFGCPLLTLVGLVAVIAIEAVVLWGSLAVFGLTVWQGVAVSCVTNAVSTFVGIPIAWLLLALVCNSSLAGHDIRTRSGQLHEVMGLAPWLVPHEYVDWDKYQGEWDWIVPAKVLVLLVPFFFASWLIEHVIATRILDQFTTRAVGVGVLIGNLATYGILMSIVARWLLRERNRIPSALPDKCAHDNQGLGALDRPSETGRGRLRTREDYMEPALIVVAVSLLLLLVSLITIMVVRRVEGPHDARASANGASAIPPFPSDYAEARASFIDAVKATGGTIESFENPKRGPHGGRLFTDIALLGPQDARVVFVLSSGTHGVEGFAGSAIQTGLLRDGISSRLPSGVRLLMTHAINPYGMAHLRRFNEDNVDVNRNFRDHTEPYPPNVGYDRLADAIAPRSLGFWSEMGAWGALSWYRVVVGTRGLQVVMQTGQYSDRAGLFYGGTFETWSNRTVRSVVQRYLSSAERVLVVDVHTGLGEYGIAEIILNVPDTSSAYERAVAIWGRAQVRSTATGESVSAHLDASLKVAFTDMLPDAEVTAVSLELGTVSPTAVFKSLRAENWLHHDGGPNHPKARDIKQRLLRAFYPDADDWREAVWERGSGVVGRALDWLGRQGTL